MVEATTLLLATVRVAVLFLGAGITWVTYNAYRRTREDFFRTATLGFAVVTIGVFIEGVLYNLTGLGLVGVHIVESVAIAIGLLLLHVSLRQ